VLSDGGESTSGMLGVEVDGVADSSGTKEGDACAFFEPDGLEPCRRIAATAAASRAAGGPVWVVDGTDSPPGGRCIVDDSFESEGAGGG
jgi:hypothetical protein